MMKRHSKRLLSLLLALMMCLSLFPVTALAEADMPAELPMLEEPAAEPMEVVAEPMGATTSLFISEYIEGSGQNKALELYNGTGSAVDFSVTPYTLKIYKDGANTPHTTTQHLNTGKVAAGDVYVVYNSNPYDNTPDTAPEIKAVGDLASDLCNSFNGNDVIELYKGETAIDRFGTIGSKDDFAKDHTYIRKSTVTTGTTTYAAADWTELPKDDFTDIGVHTFGPGPKITHTPVDFSWVSTKVAVNFDAAISAEGGSISNANITYGTDENLAGGTDVVDNTAPYSAEIPPSAVAAGKLYYRISATDAKGTRTSPIYCITVETKPATCAVPVANPAAGCLNKGDTVALSSTTHDAEIWYTTDGTEPTGAAPSTKYTKPIELKKACTIKALAVHADSAIDDSTVFSATYTLKTEKPVPSIKEGTTVAGAKIALTSGTKDAKIYYTISAAASKPTTPADPTESETASNFLYNPNTPIEITGSKNEKVIIKAIAIDQASTNKLDDSDIVTLTYTIKEPTAIKTARGYTGSVIVKGIVTFQDGSSFGIQDATAGIVARIYDNKPAVGDEVTVQGTISSYKNLLQLDSAAVLINGGIKTLPAAEVKNLTALYANDNAAIEALEGQRIQLEGLTLGKINSTGDTIATDMTGKTIVLRKIPAPNSPITEGSLVDLIGVVGQFDKTYQIYLGSADHMTVAIDQYPPVLDTSRLGVPTVGKDFRINVGITDSAGLGALKVTYQVDAGASTELTLTTLDAATGLYHAVVPKAALVGGAKLKLTFSLTDAHAGTPNTGSTVVELDISSDPRVLAVTPALNVSTGADKNPEISVKFENAGATPVVKLTLNNGTEILKDQAMINGAITEGSGTATYTPAENLADGRYDATVTIINGIKITNYTWSFVVGAPISKLYFGQLHAHTGEYSDGSGDLADGLNYLKNIPNDHNVDFAAFTDHSNYFDTKDAANEAAALGDISKMTEASKADWLKYTGDMDTFNGSVAANKKIAVPGFEMTWSGGPGHINTFNSTGLVSRNNSALNQKSDYAGMKAYYELLKQPENKDTISQFNHPGTTFGTFGDFAFWDPLIDERISLIEVGNGEGAIGSSGHFPSYQYYTQALDKGWHLAPTNNQDNHKGKWGDANDARSVILADSLTEQGLLDGMRNMSMYATEDKNLEIHYTANGLIMGSVSAEKPSTIHIVATLKDPDEIDKIGKVEIISNGGVVVGEAHSFPTNSDTLDVTLSGKDAAYSYYFLRVTQPDRDIAVTAPVWFGAVPKVGITDVTTDTVMPVKGTALNVTTSIYNYEDEDFVIDSITYSKTRLGQKVEISTEANPGAVLAGVDAKVFNLSYTPTDLGFITLSVEIKGKLGSTPFTFERKLELEVLDPDKIVSIAIDAGHSNFYVSGNYAGSDAAFIEMAARSGIRVLRLQKGELTTKKLTDEKIKMLVLTVPFKEANKDVTDSLYSSDELAVLTAFEAAGGSFIITSKSDRLEPKNPLEKAAVISNGILEAIGAKARVAQSIVIDAERNANESYRINLGGDSASDRLCFNYAAMSSDALANKMLTGVESTTNNLFSAYNSAPIIPNGATALVSGFPGTTWGTNFEDLLGKEEKFMPKPDATVVTNKGATHLMTVEPLAHNNFAIVSGVTFFSTFEVKPDLDFAGQKQNSNYQIVQNILDQVKPVLVPDKISDVQAAPEGERFTIEGVVTSNASGYDRNTAFFDCIYVQDATGGINVFPVSGDIRIGQTVQITGYTSSYQGERQLQATYTKVVDYNVKPAPAPKSVTVKEASTGTALGSLVQVSGTVSSFTTPNNTVETIVLNDGNGNECRVFIDGYITKDKTIPGLSVGANFTAIGLSSKDTAGFRIRVRDRAEVFVPSTPGYRPSSPKPVDPKVDAPAVVVNQEASVSADGTSASAAISSRSLTSALQNANQSGSTEIIISAALPKEGADKVTSLTVSLPSAALSSVAGNKNLDLTVATPSGSVTFGNDAVKALAGLSNPSVNTAVAGTDVTFTVSANGKPVENLAGGFTAAVPAAKATAGSVLMVVNADGTTAILPKSMADAGMVKGLLPGNATLRVVDNAKSFGDVPATHWCSSSVAFVSSHGLFQGTGEKIFSPDVNTSRGMLITVLYRLEGTPTTKGEAPADVAKDSFYATSAAWAKELGISNNEKLEGDREISRQELVTMIYRYAKAMKLDMTPTAKLDSFTDSNKVADWAKDAMSWAVSIGLVKGVPGGGLAPDDLASRAQVAAIMERLVSYLVA